MMQSASDKKFRILSNYMEYVNKPGGKWRKIRKSNSKKSANNNEQEMARESMLTQM